jgi:hypothetical protein
MLATSLAKVFAKSTTRTIKKLLNSRPDIGVDKDLVAILEENPWADVEVLTPLLVFEEATIDGASEHVKSIV